MSLIKFFSDLANGDQTTVDTSVNTVVTSSVIVGGDSGTELTKVVLDGLIASSVHNGQVIDKFILSSTDISNKFVTLSKTPGIPANAILYVDGAPTLTFSEDYTVSGAQLGWSGLTLDGILAQSDNITVTYTI
jgi:hypothetical protein